MRLVYPPTLYDLTFAAIEQIGHPITRYSLHNVQVSDPKGEEDTSPYNNYIHDDGRVILCIYNFGGKDHNRGTPNALKWTDMMTAACAEVMKRTNGQMSNLEAV